MWSPFIDCKYYKTAVAKPCQFAETRYVNMDTWKRLHLEITYHAIQLRSRDTFSGTNNIYAFSILSFEQMVTSPAAMVVFLV